MSVVHSGFFLLPILAVLAPLVARGLGRWVRIPIVVFELLLGILAGPSLLGWVEPSDLFAELADFGLAMLFFMAGAEIRFGAIAGRPARRASLGWLISLVAGVVAGFILAPGPGAVVIGVALCSTALGTLMPILRDAKELDTPFGQAITAIGAVGEFGPLVAISLFLGTREVGVATLVLVGFVLVAALAIWLAVRADHGSLHRFVNATLHTSGQFAVRLVFLILGGLVAVSLWLDLDMLLGAFTAGIVWQLIMRSAKEADRDAVESKVEAVAFGFFVPLFFLYTGVTFNLSALVADWRILVLLPIFAILLLVIRGLPSRLAAPVGSTRRDRWALTLLGATGLPIIVAVTTIGTEEQLISPGIASALVGAGMLSVLLYPLIGMTLHGDRQVVTSPAYDPLSSPR
ncbi:cation:proton antiporter [Microbacterium rhizomatis]|uniref:Cation:proton antiporter n=1 Tax=Microbacterium rhizomatis TaxID=1631477 RepID=A0A5J5J052_9MICO|nr:cation:proton antiporter [Microbacterium rhizomatis]KAA9107891.1 cation:proton antiporter [Microbacterium rhizomatis]